MVAVHFFIFIFPLFFALFFLSPLFLFFLYSLFACQANFITIYYYVAAK